MILMAQAMQKRIMRAEETEARVLEFDPDNDGFKLYYKQAVELHKRLG